MNSTYTAAFFLDSEAFQICEVTGTYKPDGVSFEGDCSAANADGGRCKHAQQVASVFKEQKFFPLMFSPEANPLLSPELTPAEIRELLLEHGTHFAV